MNTTSEDTPQRQLEKRLVALWERYHAICRMRDRGEITAEEGNLLLSLVVARIGENERSLTALKQPATLTDAATGRDHELFFQPSSGDARLMLLNKQRTPVLLLKVYVEGGTAYLTIADVRNSAPHSVIELGPIDD